MAFIRERFGKWIAAAIILTVGILCIVSGAKMGSNSLDTYLNAQDTIDAISITLGVVFLVVGGLSFVMAVVLGILAKRSFAIVALPGAILIAFGVSLVVVKYAYTFIDLLLRVVPYLLIAVGAVVLLDAIYTLIRAIMSKNLKTVLASFIFMVIIASAAVVLGALCVGSEPVIKYGVQLIVFGVIVTLVACLQILQTFVKLPDTLVVVKQGEEN